MHIVHVSRNILIIAGIIALTHSAMAMDTPADMQARSEVKRLLAAGANLNAANQYGETPFLRAVGANNLERARALLEAGVNANQPDETLHTPLMHAVLNGNKPMVDLLIDADVDLNMKDDSGYSPLFMAVKQHKPDIARALIKAGADVTVTDPDGNTIFYNAVAQPDLFAELKDAIAEREEHQLLLGVSQKRHRPESTADLSVENFYKKRKITHRTNDPEIDFAYQQLVTGDAIVKRALFNFDNIRRVLAGLIRSEKKHIAIAIYEFTDSEIAQELINAHKRGVKIEVIANKVQRQSDKNKEIYRLAHAGISVYSWFPPKGVKGIMHNKFAIFDSALDNRALLWDGSYNFTYAASTANKENVLVLQDYDLVATYRKHLVDLRFHARPLQFKVAHLRPHGTTTSL
jgi:hypothetical protein